MPIFFLLLDWQVRRVLGRREFEVALIAKLLFIGAYWTVMTCAYFSFKADPVVETQVLVSSETYANSTAESADVQGEQ